MKRTVVTALFGLLLVGCEPHDQSALEAELDAMRNRPEGGLEPLPDQPVYQALEYRGEGRRTPFDSGEAPPVSVLQVQGSGVRPDPERSPDPLERFALDDLRLAGTLTIAGRVVALIQTPEGELVRLHVGQYLGENSGRAVAIGSDHVEIVELRPEGDGYSESNRRLTLDGSG